MYIHTNKICEPFLVLLHFIDLIHRFTVMGAKRQRNSVSSPRVLYDSIARKKMSIISLSQMSSQSSLLPALYCWWEFCLHTVSTTMTVLRIHHLTRLHCFPWIYRENSPSFAPVMLLCHLTLKQIIHKCLLQCAPKWIFLCLRVS